MKALVVKKNASHLKRFFLTALLFTVMVHWSCGGRHNGKEVEGRATGIIDRAEHIAILSLDAPEFANLSLDDQIAAYYLAKAVWAGRDIAYDQLHPKHLEIRDFSEDIALNIEYGAPPYVTDPFWSYLKFLWIHNGFYDLRNLNLQRLPLQQREFDQLMYLALSNSGGQLGTMSDINFKRFWIKDHLLDPTLDRSMYAQKFRGTVDLMDGAAPNLYQDLSTEEVQGYKHRFPRNSKLVKRDGKIVELVYRMGDETWAPGPYANDLGQVVEFLENARPYLPPERVGVVDHLLHHFRTGDPSSFENAANIWRNGDAPVDFILGFSDGRFDPMGLKGLWTGFLFVADDEAQKRVSDATEVIVRRIKQFPPNSKTERLTPYGGKIKAVQLLCATGCNGPLCPDIYTDPPGKKADGANSQRLIFTNVITARAEARTAYINASRSADSDRNTANNQCAADIAICKALIRSILNLDDWGGAVVPVTDKLPPAAVLECILDELTYLWLIRDPEFVETGILPDPAAADEAYRQFGCGYVHSLRDVSFSGKNVEKTAIQVIGTYLLRAGGCLIVEEIEGQKTCRILDYDRMRETIVTLADHVVELLTEGEAAAQDKFIAQYYTAKVNKFARGERDRHRGQSAFFTDEAFTMPWIKADINPMGGIKRVYIEQCTDLGEQMFYSSRKLKTSDKPN